MAKRPARPGGPIDPRDPAAVAELGRKWKFTVPEGADLSDHARGLLRELSDPSTSRIEKARAVASLVDLGAVVPDPETAGKPTVFGPDGKPLPSQGKPPKAKPRLVTQALADVEEEETDWLWPGRIPVGTVTVLMGRQGDGKSTLLGWLTSQVSKGKPWPDSPEDNEPGAVLLLQSEESLSQSVRRRLNGFGFDPSNVHAVRGVDRGRGDKADYFSLSEHVDLLDAECERRGNVRLIIIDPLASYLHGTGGRSDIEARHYLQPLFDLAERHGLAVVCVIHPNKDAEKDILDRASGTGAYTQMARASWYLSVDPNDKTRRLLSLMKGNLAGMTRTALACHYDDRRRLMTWFGEPVELDAREVDHLLQRQAREAKLNAKRGPDPTESKRAQAFLLEFLETNGGPVLQSAAQDQALNLGIKESSFLKGLKRLITVDGRVKRFRGEEDGRYWLRFAAAEPAAAPADGAEPPADGSPEGPPETPPEGPADGAPPITPPGKPRAGG